MRQRRQHRALVTGTGADLQHFLRHAVLEQRLGHARNDPRLGNRLAVADRQRDVFVGARGQCFIEKQMSRQTTQGGEHAFVADAAFAAQAIGEGEDETWLVLHEQ